jgi:hypothetical protein
MSNEDFRGYGFELPLLLFGGFRSIIDELHAELARRGHPDLRPAHGFALQAIGLAGATATEAGRAGGWAFPSRPRARRSSGSSSSGTCAGPVTIRTGGASW